MIGGGRGGGVAVLEDRDDLVGLDDNDDLDGLDGLDAEDFRFDRRRRRRERAPIRTAIRMRDPKTNKGKDSSETIVKRGSHSPSTSKICCPGRSTSRMNSVRV